MPKRDWVVRVTRTWEFTVEAETRQEAAALVADYEQGPAHSVIYTTRRGDSPTRG